MYVQGQSKILFSEIVMLSVRHAECLTSGTLTMQIFMISPLRISGLYFNGKHITEVKDLNMDIDDFTSRVLLEP